MRNFIQVVRGHILDFKIKADLCEDSDILRSLVKTLMAVVHANQIAGIEGQKLNPSPYKRFIYLQSKLLPHSQTMVMTFVLEHGLNEYPPNYSQFYGHVSAHALLYNSFRMPILRLMAKFKK